MWMGRMSLRNSISESVRNKIYFHNKANNRIPMNHIEELYINVPNNLYGTELSMFCYSHRKELTSNSMLNEAICRIVKTSIIERRNKTIIGKLRLSSDERRVLDSLCIENIKNVELATRIYDVCNNNSGLEQKKEISKRYISLFDLKNACEYLIRAIEVRAIPALSEERFLTEVMNRLTSKSFYGNEWRLVLTALSKNYKPLFSKYVSLVENKIRYFANNNQYECERQLINGLSVIGGISKTEAILQVALSHEREGLKAWNSRKENTFYPNMADYFKKAYVEIVKVKAIYPDDEKRIKNKYADVESYVAGIISKIGVPMITPIDDLFKDNVAEYINNLNISNVVDVIVSWIGIPYTTTESIVNYKKIVARTSYLSLFGSVVKMGRGGNIEGQCDAEKGVEIECHSHIRLRVNYMIRMIIAEIEKNRIEINEQNLEEMLLNYKPSFISQYSLPLWFLGILHGLKGEFIEASCILVPQIENALRGWAEELCGDLAKLEKSNNQDEANLTIVLRNLKPYIDDLFYNDIELFLNNSSGVNFRNKLSHGLLSAQEILSESPYLLKIAADIYWGNNKYLKHNNNDSINE